MLLYDEHAGSSGDEGKSKRRRRTNFTWNAMYAELSAKWIATDFLNMYKDLACEHAEKLLGNDPRSIYYNCNNEHLAGVYNYCDKKALFVHTTNSCYHISEEEHDGITQKYLFSCTHKTYPYDHPYRIPIEHIFVCARGRTSPPDPANINCLWEIMSAMLRHEGLRNKEKRWSVTTKEELLSTLARYKWLRTGSANQKWLNKELTKDDLLSLATSPFLN